MKHLLLKNLSLLNTKSNHLKVQQEKKETLLLPIMKRTKTLILREHQQMLIIPRVERIPTKVTIRLTRSTFARHLSQKIKRKWLEKSPKQTGHCMI